MSATAEFRDGGPLGAHSAFRSGWVGGGTAAGTVAGTAAGGGAYVPACSCARRAATEGLSAADSAGTDAAPAAAVGGLCAGADLPDADGGGGGGGEESESGGAVASSHARDDCSCSSSARTAAGSCAPSEHRDQYPSPEMKAKKCVGRRTLMFGALMGVL